MFQERIIFEVFETSLISILWGMLFFVWGFLMYRLHAKLEIILEEGSRQLKLSSLAEKREKSIVLESHP